MYRGRPTDCHVLLALAKSGPIEIELIEVLGGRSIHSEALEQGRTGPHHLRCRVDDIASTMAALEAEGLRPSGASATATRSHSGTSKGCRTSTSS